MADILKNLFGGGAAPSAVPAGDADFADYAGAPVPTPASIVSDAASSSAPIFSTGTARPYTKWYKIWERTTVADFYQEMFLLPFVITIIVLHLWGMRANRRKSKAWMAAHAPVLQQEFAVVGFGNAKSNATGEPLKEKTANEYSTYATGRQNIAFLDAKLTLAKRYNPVLRFGESLIGFLFEGFPATTERSEYTIYSFDGRETALVPDAAKANNSTHDGFVFAIVHKDLMNRLRQDRYDLSLTSTKDHAKLPAWATVMSESAEITDAILTPELMKAIDKAGDAFEAFIISDQPMDQPKKLDELVPKKRTTLSVRVPSNDDYSSTLPLFEYVVRVTDRLVATGRFRPEALRRVKQTRDEEMRKIKKIDDDEKAEDRKLKADKDKKEKRDNLLKGMSAEEQKKYLDKEREKDMRKSQKKMTMRG